ncbi:MAG: EAL domain-containing protein [Thermodesulfobacteria bacterium]|nr:EAL domain-containing protein [Thermodesulfobacteriota bacterium]
MAKHSLTDKDVLKLLRVDDIVTYFQPIVYVAGKKVVGFEALTRGVKGVDIIPPLELFARAEQKGVKLEFDRICREKAFQEFKKVFAEFPGSVLFFNFDGSSIDKIKTPTGHIFRLAEKYQLPPQNIVIEITENRVRSLERLKRFIDYYKDLGFLIALDDVGIEYSNLHRIPELKPHILKIDRVLIENIDKEYYKQKVVKALTFLAKDIGALTLAEGIETEDELLRTMELGIMFHQGFYFSQPKPLETIYVDEVYNYFNGLIFKFYNKMACYIHNRKKIVEKYKKIIDEVISELSKVDCKEFEGILKKWVIKVPEVECFYIVNMQGIMVTNTIFHKHTKVSKSPLFEPASVGKSLFCKEYIYPLISGIFKVYVTEPYVSLATGNMVITISKVFKAADNKEYILCVDFVSSEE